MRKRTGSLLRFAALAGIFSIAPLAPLAAQDSSPSATLPGGASSLQESYEDWSVACRIVEKKRLCAASQQQMQENGQRVIAIELQIAEAEGLSATLILPFGLLLDAGANLAIDEKPFGETLRYRTCIPAGCLISTRFDAAMLKDLKAGKVLNLRTTSVDARQTAFAISLKGFAAAMDRLKQLTAS